MSCPKVFIVMALLLSVGAGCEQPAPSAKPICAIDMGSNSFRRIVGSFENGRYQQIAIEPITVGVGDDVSIYGRISDEKLAEIDRVLSRFRAACEADGAAPVVAVGTAAFRDAPNGPQVVELAARLGITMEIATETREAQLAYLVGSLGQDGFAVVDNGSRSIELVARARGETQSLVLGLGYRIAYETFFAAAPEPGRAAAAFRNRLLQDAARASFMKGKSKLVGVEFGEMAEALFEPGPVEGRVFTLAVLKRRLEQITAATAAEFEALKRRHKDLDRALPRLVAAITFMEQFGYAELELTSRELGAGLIIEAGLRR